MASQLDFELYRSLRAEASGYVEKVPALWLQKFVLVGAVIAFLVTEPLSNIKGSETTLALAAVATLPVLAMLLDAKMFEYALHARAISMFIAQHFADDGPVADWEGAMWSQAGSRAVRRLTCIRSIATWTATAIPTVVILFAAGLVIEQVLDNGAWTWAPTAVLAVGYLGCTAWGAALIYRIDPRTESS